jgi:hypothetical protein
VCGLGGWLLAGDERRPASCPSSLPTSKDHWLATSLLVLLDYNILPRH